MMRKFDLNGEWQFKAVSKYEKFPEAHQGAKEWMRATVPGTVHTDLMSNNIIADPFVRLNELDVQWIDSQQWIYQREFMVNREVLSEREIELVAEGLDAYARIKLNGKIVGGTSNMFVEHRFNVKQFLKAGKNVIEILFDSPVMRSKKLEQKYGRLKVALEPHRVYVRKAQYSFGWDWGPKLTTSGIWRNISLEAYSNAILQDPHVRVITVNKNRAVIECSVVIGGNWDSSCRFLVTVSGEGDVLAESKMLVRGRKVSLRLTVPHPKLWWPHGYGAQAMYVASFSVMQESTKLHSLQVPFAIRTVRLLQEKDEEGKSFVVEVNRVKIFCKGADWIPCDSFLPRVQDSTYEKLLTMATEANMNMIRVWGGGVYENDIFYDLCDRLGLMVWQDFMFACGEYPERPWFLKQVEDEASKAVKRLRNHPSIVLWCGNNECEWLFCIDNPGKSPDDMKGAKMFRDLLPNIVRQHDGTRPYWRSSPFGSEFPNAESNGNHHQWKVWSFWKDYPEYEKSTARFVTEFGFQAPANEKTFESSTLPEDRHAQSRVMEHHNKQIEGTERLFRFQVAHMKTSTSFSDFIYKGQLVQAEALKTAVEHWRRRKFKTAGALFWQLNDCWPVSSWSVIDSALQPKAAYYYAKNFFAPILVSFRKVDGAVEIWGTNDRLEQFSGHLEVSLRTFDGATNQLHERNISLSRNSSNRIVTISQRDFELADRTRTYLLAMLKSGTQVVAVNRFFFVEPKHMQLQNPEISLEVQALKENTHTVTLKAKVFAKNVYLFVEGKMDGIHENFFDLDAGDPKHVVVLFPGPPDQLKTKLRVISLLS